jgi:single-stranded DNA-binding protein
MDFDSAYPLPNLNSVTLAGKVGKALGLIYRQDGRPLLKFVVITEEENAALGKTFTTAIPCELGGEPAERLAEDLYAGDTVVVTGKLAYRTGTGHGGGSLGVYCRQVQRLGAARLSGAA